MLITYMYKNNEPLKLCIMLTFRRRSPTMKSERPVTVVATDGNFNGTPIQYQPRRRIS